MIKSIDTLKMPGQTRNQKRQKNNGNSGIKVRMIIVLDHFALHCGRSSNLGLKSQSFQNLE